MNGGGMSIETWLAERDEPGRARELERRVWEELACEASLDASNISISITEREATLAGTVASYPEKREAERAAKRVRGLRAVTNDIAVSLPPGDARSDRALRQAVRQALQQDVVVPPRKVTATVAEGTVTLEGTVSWEYQRSAAERAVSYLRGVHSVVNRIAVAPPSRPVDLAHRIRMMLRRDPDLHGDRISVTARGGIVEMRGHVRSLAERAEAEEDVRAVPGVETVEDTLAVE